MLCFQKARFPNRRRNYPQIFSPKPRRRLLVSGLIRPPPESFASLRRSGSGGVCPKRITEPGPTTGEIHGSRGAPPHPPRRRAGADALRSLGVGDGAGAAQGDAAVDLNATSFDAFLGAAREPFAVVEFFAHWCPACRNYKPHYENVAKLFNGPDAAHPGRVLMTRVDCALKAPPTKFVSAKWDRKQEKSEIKLIDDGRTAERLLKWINNQMESSFTLDDKKYENESILPKNASGPEQVVRAISDVEEATAHALQIILEHKVLVKLSRFATNGDGHDGRISGDTQPFHERL